MTATIATAVPARHVPTRRVRFEYPLDDLPKDLSLIHISEPTRPY